MAEQRHLITFVVPAWNENESLELLFEEIRFVCEEDYDFEVIFVDDGSRDNSWNTIRRLSRRHSNVKGIRQAKNYGKACALDAGFKRAQGDFIVQLDADLQDDPAEVPKMLEKLKEGHDMVSGWKSQRQDPWGRVLSSWAFNFFTRLICRTQLRDHNSGFKIYRPEAALSLNLYGDMHRFIPALLAAQGMSIAEVAVNHRRRRFGKSKYTINRVFNGIFDLLTVMFVVGFRQRPMHFLGSVGIVSLGVGALGLAYLAALWVSGEGIGGRPLLIYSAAALLLGFQMLATGMIAELFISISATTRVPYRIAEFVTGNKNRAKFTPPEAPPMMDWDAPKEL